MADLSDVLTGLAAVIGAALYNGSTPYTGANTIILPGWPNSLQMEKNLQAMLTAIVAGNGPNSGAMYVSIYSGKAERNTTRYLWKWRKNGTAANGLVPMAREIRRTMREFQITIWAPTPQLRDQTGALIDVALGGLRNLPLADGSQAFISYGRTTTDDVPQKEYIFRRDGFYQVEYGTFQTMQAPVVTSVHLTVKGGIDVTDLQTEILTLPKAAL